jgi:hypothetical protein
VKIVVIGGTGLIGSKTVPILRQGGHEVVAASPKSGINIITGEGFKEVMGGTQVGSIAPIRPFLKIRRCWNFRGLRPQPSCGGDRSRRPAPRCAIDRRY